MFLSVTTKKLNWEILFKNLVTFKVRVRMDNLILWEFTEKFDS